MDAPGNGDGFSWTYLDTAPAGDTFPDTDNRFSFCHGKAPFLFLFIIQGSRREFSDEVTWQLQFMETGSKKI